MIIKCKNEVDEKYYEPKKKHLISREGGGNVKDSFTR